MGKILVVVSGIIFGLMLAFIVRQQATINNLEITNDDLKSEINMWQEISRDQFRSCQYLLKHGENRN